MNNVVTKKNMGLFPNNCTNYLDRENRTDFMKPCAMARRFGHFWPFSWAIAHSFLAPGTISTDHDPDDQNDKPNPIMSCSCIFDPLL